MAAMGVSFETGETTPTGIVSWCAENMFERAAPSGQLPAALDHPVRERKNFHRSL
jgi:hypothetical protein